MPRIAKQLRSALRALWIGLRQWSGDAAYETYTQCTARSGETRMLSASEFYIDQLHRKYSRPNRCC